MVPRSRFSFVVATIIATVGLWPQRPAAVQNDGTARAISIFPESIHPGDVVRVQISGSERFTINVFGKEFASLVGVDLDTKPGTYPLRVKLPGGAVLTNSLIVVAKNFTVRRLRVAPDFVEPPPDTVERITRELKLTEGIFHTTTPKKWSGAFVLPVDGTPTSNFGTRSYFNGQRRSPHAGVDFLAAPGTPIRAANHGVIALAEPLYFTGNTVIVDYGDGLYSLFAHLSRIDVMKGESVIPESIVGLLGATGRVTGAHLHWSVRLQGARVDPLSLVAATK